MEDEIDLNAQNSSDHSDPADITLTIAGPSDHYIVSPMQPRSHFFGLKCFAQHCTAIQSRKWSA